LVIPVARRSSSEEMPPLPMHRINKK